MPPSTSPNAPGERAFEHVRVLTEEIGARPAGSAAERRAGDYVAGQLERFGYAVERQPVTFAARRFLPLQAVAGAVLIVAGWVLPQFAWLAVPLPLLIMALPELARASLRRTPARDRSENVVALQPANRDRPALLLCAHLDSARALPYRSRLLLRLNAQALFWAQRVALGLMLVGLLHIIGFAAPAFLFAVSAWSATLSGGWLLAADLINQLARRERYSPGANDNASGVGVLLALAEHFAAHPPRNLRPGFLFTGAEETGLHGAAAFAAHTHDGEIAVLNVDMVGAGDTLRYVTHEGVFATLATDAQLNELIRAACPRAEPMRYTVRSGDYAALLRSGVRATSLQISGSQADELLNHTISDSLAAVDVQSLSLAAAGLQRVVEQYGQHDICHFS